MRAVIDDRQLNPDRPTLASALDAARADAGSRHRVIVEVHADGRKLGDHELDGPSDEPGTVAEVRFVTADPILLVEQTLLEVADGIESAGLDQRAAADLIQVGRIEEAAARLGGALPAWDAVVRSLADGAALVGLDVERMTVDTAAEDAPGEGPEPLGPLFAELAVKLAELKRSIEAADWVGVSDALAYDLAAEPARWASVLRSVARQTRALGA